MIAPVVLWAATLCLVCIVPTPALGLDAESTFGTISLDSSGNLVLRDVKQVTTLDYIMRTLASQASQIGAMQNLINQQAQNISHLQSEALALKARISILEQTSMANAGANTNTNTTNNTTTNTSTTNLTSSCCCADKIVSVIEQWQTQICENNLFVEFQQLTDGVQAIDAATIDGEQYVVVAGNISSIVYRYDGDARQFTVFQNISSPWQPSLLTDVQFSVLDGLPCLLLVGLNRGCAVYVRNTSSGLFRNRYEIASSSVVSATLFTFNSAARSFIFLALANFMESSSSNSGNSNIQSNLYIFGSDSRFTLHQQLDTIGARRWKYFAMRNRDISTNSSYPDDAFLALSNQFDSVTSSHATTSALYKFNFLIKQFELFQEFETLGGMDWEFFTVSPSPTAGADGRSSVTTTDPWSFLVVANPRNGSITTVASVIYVYDPSLDRFKEYQRLATNGAEVWQHFQIGQTHYLVSAEQFSKPFSSTIFRLDEKSNTGSSSSSSTSSSNSVGYFEVYQRLNTPPAVDVAVFSIGKELFLAYANLRMENSPSSPVLSGPTIIYHLNSICEAINFTTTGATSGCPTPSSSSCSSSSSSSSSSSTALVSNSALSQNQLFAQLQGNVSALQMAVSESEQRVSGLSLSVQQSIPPLQAGVWTLQQVSNAVQNTLCDQDILSLGPSLSAKYASGITSFVWNNTVHLAVVSPDVSQVVLRHNRSSLEPAPAFATFFEVNEIGGRDWQYFEMDGISYLALSIYFDNLVYTKSVNIYRFDMVKGNFSLLQRIPTTGAVKSTFFTIDGQGYLAICLHFDGLTYGPFQSPIYRFNRTADRFVLATSITTIGATQMTYFKIGAIPCLLVTNLFMNAQIFRLDTLSTASPGPVLYQNLNVTQASGSQYFVIDSVAFLAVSVFFNSTGGSNPVLSPVYRLNNATGLFELHQQIKGTASSSGFTFFREGSSSSAQYYLFQTNYLASAPVDNILFKFQAASTAPPLTSSTSSTAATAMFEEVDIFTATAAIGSTYFDLDGVPYLALARNRPSSFTFLYFFRDVCLSYK